jgi:3-phosphoshikimate 1-carboxyvinyltransferase
MSRSVSWRVRPRGTIQGDISVPGDKSISHRSVMIGSLADGVTEVSNFLEGEDTRATAAAFRAMGVSIEGDNQGSLRIEGRGLQGLQAPSEPLDLGNSGTGMRLLTGVLAGQRFDSTVTGDVSLSSRPMVRIARPLGDMGAQVGTASGGTPPLHITGGSALAGIHYDMPVASAQVKSCLLFAGLYAKGETRVTSPGPCRDHTERMLRGFGYAVEEEGDTVAVEGGGELRATPVEVPGDISSAAFFLVAASIARGGDLTLRRVGLNPTRRGVIDILQLMGADITISNEDMAGAEPVGDVRVREAALKGIEIPPDLVANAIDEFPVLFVAAAVAHGETVLGGAEELRVKESDRIGAMAAGLSALGARAQALPDGMVITGCDELNGGEVDSHGDHRIAMAFAVAALRCRADVTVRDCANVATSFPGFASLIGQCGLGLEIVP